MSQPIDMTESVKRGAHLLDEHFPGWYRDVDTERLDMGQGSYMGADCGCVLAQVAFHQEPEQMSDGTTDGFTTYGFYVTGLDLVGLNPREAGAAAKHGFCTPFSYPELDRLWKEAIATRLAAQGNEAQA